MKRTAIFGGTFCPPHNGHLKMVSCLESLEEIEKIIIIPANIPPHKKMTCISAEHRKKMCELAFGRFKKVTISDYEILNGGKSYTVNTLKYFKEKGIIMPYLVIGADSLKDFKKWYCYKEILNMSELLVYDRIGISNADEEKAELELKNEGGKIKRLGITPDGVSSTQVREALAQNKSAENLIPAEVKEYIEKNNFFRGSCIWTKI